MKFKIRVRNIGGKSEWWETYDKPVTDAAKFGREVIENYNQTLRDNETAREFLESVVLDASVRSSVHQWEKTNSFTVVHHGQMLDTFKCKVCGITGKRFRLSEGITIDRKAKVYQDCIKAEEHLKKMRIRKSMKAYYGNKLE